MAVCNKITLIIYFCSFVVMGVDSIRVFSDRERQRRANLVQQHLKKFKRHEGAVRLVGGRNDMEGNVEIFHNGRWGPICDDEWDSLEAAVVCQRLGFDGKHKITHSSHFGQPNGKYWMDNLFCDGTEKTLAKCRFDGWGVHDCTPEEAAGVICSKLEKDHQDEQPIAEDLPKQAIPKRPLHKMLGGKPLETRLAGGRVKGEGRVEIKYNGVWGSICGDGWSIFEAMIVCKDLGLGYANDAIQTDFFGKSSVLLSGVTCTGNEHSISECLHDQIGDVTCPGKKGNVASVICVHQMADLILDHNELMRSAYLHDQQLFLLQCAMEENCLATAAYTLQSERIDWHLETRRLLRFTASALNAGTADFRPNIPKHLWEWHMCHMHYHSMEVFATFDILNSLGKKVAEGHKASFCLEDNVCLPGIEKKYACANYGDQGVSVNCSDIYKHNIDCQWVDVTELEAGEYTFKVAVNPEFKVAEMSYDNNAAVCKLSYSESYARVHDCHLQRP